MGKRRSRTEIRILAAEAERRVRAGQSLTEVARALRESRSTLCDWAARGGWRLKDILAEQDEERARLVEERIAAIRRREEEAELARRAAFAESLARARARAAGMSGRPGGSGGAGGGGEYQSFDPAPSRGMTAAQLAEAIERARFLASGRPGSTGGAGDSGGEQ